MNVFGVLSFCEANLFLQALRIPVIAVGALVWRNTLGWSSISITCALSPMLGCASIVVTTGRRGGSTGSGCRSPGWSSGCAGCGDGSGGSGGGAAGCCSGSCGGSGSCGARSGRDWVGSCIWVDDVGGREGRVEGTPLDVRVDNICAWGVGLKIRWLTRISWARTTCNTWCTWVRGGWVRRVEPQHVDRVIIPDGHDEDTSRDRLTHDSETALGCELVGVSESTLLSSAEGVGDGVT